MKYVLCLVFSHNMGEILLMHRNNEPYKGLLNAPGGKIDDGETVAEALARELKEETNISASDCEKVEYAMSIKYPNNNKVYVYYAILPDSPVEISYKHREGDLDWYNVNGCLDVTNPVFAGEGDLPYFINYALLKEGVR